MPTIQKITGAVNSTENLPIRYDICYPEAAQNKLPVILFLHGFKGFKDWGTFPEVCRQIAGHGFAVLAMNFSLNGIGENKMEFDRLDLFARETFSQDLDDIGMVIKAVGMGEMAAKGLDVETDKIGILGHSRGGHIAVTAAAEYDEIDCLVTWAAVDDYNARWNKQMVSDWEAKGVTEVKNGRTGQIMPLKKVVYDDARENAERVIALKRVKELQKPALFIHGQDDEAVSPENALRLYEACSSKEKEIMLIPGTGHTFGGAHPFNENKLPEPLSQALAKTVQWFFTYLK